MDRHAHCRILSNDSLVTVLYEVSPLLSRPLSPPANPPPASAREHNGNVSIESIDFSVADEDHFRDADTRAEAKQSP